jgi:hypothetical protein
LHAPPSRDRQRGQRSPATAAPKRPMVVPACPPQAPRAPGRNGGERGRKGRLRGDKDEKVVEGRLGKEGSIVPHPAGTPTATTFVGGFPDSGHTPRVNDSWPRPSAPSLRRSRRRAEAPRGGARSRALLISGSGRLGFRARSRYRDRGHQNDARWDGPVPNGYGDLDDSPALGRASDHTARGGIVSGCAAATARTTEEASCA